MVGQHLGVFGMELIQVCTQPTMNGKQDGDCKSEIYAVVIQCRCSEKLTGGMETCNLQTTYRVPNNN
jgi:hypothetical protein